MAYIRNISYLHLRITRRFAQNQNSLYVIFTVLTLFSVFGPNLCLRLFASFCLIYVNLWVLLFTLILNTDQMNFFFKSFFQSSFLPKKKVVERAISSGFFEKACIAPNMSIAVTGFYMVDEEHGVIIPSEIRNEIERLNNAQISHFCTDLSDGSDVYEMCRNQTDRDILQRALDRCNSGRTPLVRSSNLPRVETPSSSSDLPRVETPSSSSDPQGSISRQNLATIITRSERVQQRIDEANAINARARWSYNESLEQHYSAEERTYSFREGFNSNRERYKKEIHKTTLENARILEENRIKRTEKTRRIFFIMRLGVEGLENFVLATPRLIACTTKIVAKTLFRVEVDTKLDLFPHKPFPQDYSKDTTFKDIALGSTALAMSTPTNTEIMPTLSENRSTPPLPPLMAVSDGAVGSQRLLASSENTTEDITESEYVQRSLQRLEDTREYREIEEQALHDRLAREREAAQTKLEAELKEEREKEASIQREREGLIPESSQRTFRPRSLENSENRISQENENQSSSTINS